jgi:hypothetical protein
VSEKQDKRISRFFKAIFRRTVEWLLIISLIFTLSAPFTPSANAKMRVPNIGSIFSAFADASPFTVIWEILDFKPHFGWLPTPPPPLTPLGFLARGSWCYGPIYICVPFCICVPLPKNWCHDKTKCLLSNIVNLFATLNIKHAKARGHRVPSYSHKGGNPDFYYRDMCINSAKINFDQFDPGTGDLLATGSARFDETSAGLVAGSKPLVNSCMPTINTPNFSPVPSPTAVNPISPFAYYQNADNTPFLTQGADKDAKKTIYGTTPRFNSSTFFLGGSQGCPAEIFTGTNGTSINDSNIITPPKPSDAKGWDKQATRCYDYYIIARALHPEWTLERTGIETDDPLTADPPRGNPDLAIFNSCQPLMSGDDSILVRQGQSPTNKGFSPVLQYNRPDLDEADYDTAKYFRNDFRKLFPTTASATDPSVQAFPNLQIPNYQNIFPCVRQPNDAPNLIPTNWDSFNATLMANYAISLMVETTVLKKRWGPMYFVPMPEDEPYTSPGGSRPGFCPNIEKINIASHPYSPREDFRKEASWLEIETSPYLYLFNNKITYIYSTDREYSNQTSFLTPKDRLFNGMPVAGYSDYNALLSKVINSPSAVPQAIINRTKYPEVMCAIVPVDILEPRKKAFDNCIMQRINYNFITWRRRNFLSYYYKRTLKPWTKPCATRFYESDDVSKCPVSMSIQQCCRIIVKDVVPMNYLKIRTCEGLRQKRNLVFGYDHIFDAELNNASTKADATARATADKATAQANLTDAQNAYNSYIAGASSGPGGSVIMNAVNNPYDNQAQMTCMSTANCQQAVETINSLYLAITEAQADLDKANQDLATANAIVVDTNFPLSSMGGKYMRVTDQASYDAALKENQKLTLLGCDETEPADYRFYHYFEKSNWPELDPTVGRLLTNGLNAMQSTIDDIIYKARLKANDAILAPASYAWSTYDAAIKAADNALHDAKEIYKRVLYESQVEKARYENAKNELKKLMEVNNIPMLLMEQGNYPADVQKAMTVATTSKARLEILSVSADKAAKIVEELQKAKDQVSKNAQDQLRSMLAQAQSKIDTNIILAAKKQADDTAATLVTQLKDGPGRSVGDAIDQLYDSLNAKENADLTANSSSFNFSGDVSAQTMALVQAMLGAGGSHMPYMRWWDTGTSAGNPTHGGSFINTLGSYDTIIGVGREAREYVDSTMPVQQTVTEPDQAAIDQAQANLDNAKNYMTSNGYPCAESDFAAYQNNWNSCVDFRDDILGYMNQFYGIHDYNWYKNVFYGHDQGIMNGNTNQGAFNYQTDYNNGCNHTGNNDNSYYQLCYHVLTNIHNLQNALDIARTRTITRDVTTNQIIATLSPQQSLTQTNQMGKINGWAGLKGHQMLTTRHSNLVCIGRHEKLFKVTGQENFVLTRAGGNYISKKDGKQWPWPLGWRGYINDPNNEFEKNLKAIGLSNAQAGDIIIYKLGSLKHISYVSGVNKYVPRFVKIESWDQSKFPTSTGTGISAGSGVERTIFQDAVPPGALIFKDPATSLLKNISQFSNTDIAKIGNQPSCEDPDFTACVLGGPGNSTWDSVEIFRPSENLRQCPYLDYSNASKNIQTAELDTGSISYCLNAGYDPPDEYRIGYNGAGAGAISDTTRCGPNWGDCSTTAPVSEVKCFPSGTTCNTPLPAYTPAPDPVVVPGTCTTQAEMQAASDAYQAALDEKSDILEATSDALANATQSQLEAEQAYNDYVDQSATQLAQLNTSIIQSQIPAGANTAPIDAAKNTLDAAIADLQAKQAAANTANQDLQNYKNANQAQIDSYNQIINDYNISNPAADDSDPSLPCGTQGAVPCNVQNATNSLAAINAQIDGFTASIDAADQAVTDAQTAVNDAQAALNTAANGIIDPTITPDPALVAQRDAIYAQIASLQTALNIANQTLAAAQADADAAEADVNAIPPLKCPWP